MPAISRLLCPPIVSRRIAAFLLAACMAPVSGALYAQVTSLPATTENTKHPVEPVKDTMTAAQQKARMAWWTAARFGMFIHWGLYAEAAGSWNGQPEAGMGEWIMNKDKIPVADYKKLAANFDPTKFNADAWVSMAKAAGVKYIVITAKHHEGFAMYNSAANKFNIVDATPFKRDPLRALAIACHKQGIKLGFYYSQDQDWTAPGGAARGGHWDKAQDGSFADYVHTKVIPQLKELLTNYEGEDAPDEIWFDTPMPDMTPQLASEIVTLLNKHPNVLWNNRLGGGYGGDFETPEQHIPAQGFPGENWETCMTINGTWGFKKQDTNFKSTETLLHNLIDIASKGGNYLLNVGPDSTGVIPEPEQQRMLAMGKWLKVNGAAIYGTHPGPFSQEHGAYSPTAKDNKGSPVWIPVWDWRATAKPGRVFVSIFQWPDGEFKLPSMGAHVTKAYLLADPQHKALKIAQNAGGITVKLPATAPDSIASVLVLDTQS
jgi:alpha-L-fucosidase